MVFLAAALLLVSAPLCAQTATPERRVALVVGNGTYKDGPLRNPTNDARAVAAALGELGFEVIARYNASARDMRRAVIEFGEKIERGGVGLFYYAGHGVQMGGRNYLLPVDAEIEREAHVESEAVDVAAVLGRMEGARNRINIVILDACRNNPYERRFRSASRGLAVTPAPSGTYIAYATAPGDVAEDGTGANSTFTTALLGAMRKPGLTLDDLFKDVRAGVHAATGGRQVPWSSSSIIGDFYFRPGAALAPPRPAPAAPMASLPPPAAPSAPVLDPLEKELVASRNANIREAPDVSSALVATLQAGTRIHVAGKVRDANWYAVERGGKRLGYVLGDLLQEAAVVPPVQPSSPPTHVQPAVGLHPQPQRFRPVQEFKDCPECPELVVVPAGSFTMGSPAGEADRAANEGPQRRVTIARAFAVGKYEVTFEQWDACVSGGGCGGYRPSDNGWGRGNRPVINVSWSDAKQYVEWLGRRTGKSYRLLSEAEWEYAARAGTTTPFHTGATITTDQANYDGNHVYANGPKGIYRERTVQVGRFAANAFGLHDMHGNVWEWVEDCWNASYAGAPSDGNAWTTGGNCVQRVLRGGSWYGDPGYARSAVRIGGTTGIRRVSLGFRVARTLD
jgi:formylglycine-generating enzyme required for sulfatase activity